MHLLISFIPAGVGEPNSQQVIMFKTNCHFQGKQDNSNTVIMPSHLLQEKWGDSKILNNHRVMQCEHEQREI